MLELWNKPCQLFPPMFALLALTVTIMTFIKCSPLLRFSEIPMRSCIVVYKMFSAEFRYYLKSSIYNPYRYNSKVCVQVNAYISFSNTLLKICCIYLVVPRTMVFNRGISMILKQNGPINRIIYNSVPKANLVAQGK